MSRSPTALAATLSALTATLVAGCAGSGTPTGIRPVDPTGAQQASDAANIVVTGSRIDGRAAPTMLSVAPPPPPPAPMLSAAMSRAPDVIGRPPYHDVGRDRFTETRENPFKLVKEEPVSTFSLDVDTASYAFTRASLNRNVLPQPDAVRPEEMINYFPYDYAPARSAVQPFSTNVAVFPSPWSSGRLLVRVGIKGYELPLVKQSLGMLLDRLDANDRVAIVTYAGSAGTALEPTAASQKARILAVLDRLGAGGSTAGAEGIRQAYALAEQNLDPQGVNRVILATDGDFNVGITDQNELKGYIERERGKGVFLSVLGFGMGNYNDALMQTLAQNGNGVAAYIDTANEARKTLVDEATSTLFPIAKDAKVQVEFNPAAVSEYRLIGYETRLLDRDDFNNDKVDAGDVGSGQTVTALYEVVPLGGPRATDTLRYGQAAQTRAAGAPRELGFVKIRYKLPKSDTSTLIAVPIPRSAVIRRFEDAPQDARFAAAVAGFAELLRGGNHAGTLRYDDVARIAVAAKGEDCFGYRAEFIQLVRAAGTARAMAAADQ